MRLDNGHECPASFVELQWERMHRHASIIYLSLYTLHTKIQPQLGHNKHRWFLINVTTFKIIIIMYLNFFLFNCLLSMLEKYFYSCASYFLYTDIFFFLWGHMPKWFSYVCHLVPQQFSCEGDYDRMLLPMMTILIAPCMFITSTPVMVMSWQMVTFPIDLARWGD